MNWKYILIVIFLAVVIGGGILTYQYLWLPQKEVKTPEERAPEVSFEYKSTTIKELINNIDKYNRQRVLVKGKFIDMRDRPMPQCIPIGTGENPEIRDGYKTYPSTWGISNQDEEISVDVINENGVHNSTLPNHTKGQEIELKGVAKSATVALDCNIDIRYKSIYIEVNAEDIDITLKSLPKILPEGNNF